MAISKNKEVLQPEYIEALGKTYAADLTRQAGIPSITTASTLNNLVKQMHSLHKDKHKHNSLELEKLVWLILHRKLQHKMHYQTAAYAQATDPTTGLGAYQPF